LVEIIARVASSADSSIVGLAVWVRGSAVDDAVSCVDDVSREAGAAAAVIEVAIAKRTDRVAETVLAEVEPIGATRADGPVVLEAVGITIAHSATASSIAI